ncbi:MAG TPA: GGDEF domain-containing protein [Candidatus Deferrimicrobiaceae bacterium]|jgi:diguanylate cyclase (GGDEF)-like protein
MSKNRVLILAPDGEAIASSIRSAPLKDVHFFVMSDWEKGVAALAQEYFSLIIIRIFPEATDPRSSGEVLSKLAPKTPIVLIASPTDGLSVRNALQCGVSDVVFEDRLADELVPLIERYLFMGYGAVRKMSLDELFEYSIPVLTTTDMNLLALTVLEKMSELVGATYGVLFREQEESGTGGFSVVASSGFADESLVAEFLLRFGGGALHAATPLPTVVPAEEISTIHPEDSLILGESRNFFLLRFDLMPGVSIHLVLGLRNLLAPDVVNSVLLDFLIRQARFAFLNSERSVQTQNLIYIDDLTKLYNSRYLNVVLDRELKRSERYRNFFSVLFMDLDFFKRINDTHGHLVGSRVLIEVGAVLRSCVRETDTVVRYGGDEFVVVLVETNADEAFLVAERMRKLIEAKWFGQENGLSLHLTISIGIAAFPEHASTKQHLLNLADQAMYRGKESTRNVVYLADTQAVP